MGRAACDEYSQTEMHPSTSTRWPGNQCEPSANSYRHANPVGHVFDVNVGLHGSARLYVVGMPPRGYLLIFDTFNPQST